MPPPTPLGRLGTNLQVGGDFLIGPQSFLGQLGQAGFGALESGLDAAGSLTEQFLKDITGTTYATDISPEELQGLIQEMQAAGIQVDIDPETGLPTDQQSDPQVAAILGAIREGNISSSGVRTLVQQMQGNRRIQEEQQAGLQEFQGLEETIGGGFQSRIDRFQRLATDPLAIRSDPEFGQVLKDVETQAAVGVREAERQGSARAAARGTGFSGKTIDTSQSARNVGRLGVFQTQNALQRLAQEALGQQQTGQAGFLTDLAGARSGLRAETRQGELDFTTPRGNVLNLQAAGLARQDRLLDPLRQLPAQVLEAGSDVVSSGIRMLVPQALERAAG